ncbi:arsenate reductase (glutaredoxin) [Pseudoalteromonas sp. SW0106-04]|uniref:arsenate reductase (glutaredoxin) n=1 Tax=Pseudoalteromonas sp. SW0106-04 TaxID=1702169 RepID=UPI0006B46D84|nr:arsenate reductase (glutaredoxin) [Pseudoalteromonas sp. SW0106-04]
MSIVIYHNPRCSKSRQTLALIEEKGVEPEVIKYLDDTPSVEQLNTLVQQLGFSSARELMRTKEDTYKELDFKNQHDEQALLNAMHHNPKLIERPIVVNGNKAVLGRPPENVLELL